jgi:ABC-2 type transport system permease protein
MQVFNAYLKILKKNIPSLSIYIIIFIILSFLLSGSGKDNQVSQFKKNKLDITVINEDRGMLGSQLKGYLGKMHNLVEIENDKEKLQDELYHRNVEYILFIPADFTDRLKAFEIENVCENVKVPSSSAGTYLDTQVEQYISTVVFYLIADVDEKQAAEYTARDLSKEVTVNLLNQNILISKTNDYYYFKYLPYIFIAVTIMGIGPILMIFNRKEINERNLCSAMSLKKKNIQIILGCFITVLGIFSVFMVIAFFIYGKNIESMKAVLYLINSFVFILIATALSYFSSIFARNTNVLNMISNVLALGMCFLGGIFVPRELLGTKLLAFSKFLPTYWYVNVIEVIQDVSSNHSLMKEIQISIGVEMLFALAIFAVALAATRIKSDARKQTN